MYVSATKQEKVVPRNNVHVIYIYVFLPQNRKWLYQEIMIIFATKQKKVGSRNNVYFCDTCLLVHDIIHSKGQHTQSYFHDFQMLNLLKTAVNLILVPLLLIQITMTEPVILLPFWENQLAPVPQNCPTNLPEQGKKLMYA